jgi:DNA-binding transcriptional ArsR family regulator
MTTFTKPANLFRVLMHPTRLTILEILRDGEQCVCHLEAVLGYRQAYISQQLIVLREAGLVEDRRDGTRIYYRVIKPEVFNLVDTAVQMSGLKLTHEKNKRVANCPCPKCNPLPHGNEANFASLEIDKNNHEKLS